MPAHAALGGLAATQSTCQSGKGSFGSQARGRQGPARGQCSPSWRLQRLAAARVSPPDAACPCAQGKVWVLADCNSWLSFPWLAWALQCVVLAGTLAAWATDSVHSFESSLWGMAAVVLYAGQWIGAQAGCL